MSQKIGMKWDEGTFGLISAGIMLDDRGRVLLCRQENEDIWVIPGGGAILHETSEDTVKREFLEESNFEVEVQRLLWIEENFFTYEGVKIHGLGFYFLVTPNNATGVWDQDEFMGQEDDLTPGRIYPLIFKWFDRSKLDSVNLYPSKYREILKTIPEHPMHIVHITYDESYRF